MHYFAAAPRTRRSRRRRRHGKELAEVEGGKGARVSHLGEVGRGIERRHVRHVNDLVGEVVDGGVHVTRLHAAEDVGDDVIGRERAVQRGQLRRHGDGVAWMREHGGRGSQRWGGDA